MAAVTSSTVTAAAMAAVASTSSVASASAIQTKASSLSKCSSSLVPLSSSSSSSSSSSKLGVSSFTPSLGSRSSQVMTRGSRRLALVSPRAATKVDVAGGDKMREGAKAPSKESLLTPRFYTTDFDEMEALLDPVNNPHYREEEFLALLNEFKTDYNQTHFVRNKEFKEAADNLQGTTREIFLEFLERSCTAEFSGFLLYKELGRRLKKKNPVVAEIFTLMSRDEARHAGFLNKAMSDFNLALDLGFLTKMRKYTFFKPKFIFYATYLSEKIGYWRYITINRHLQNKPEHIIFPIFKYFFNWCQDENRHGDFFTALLKNQPKFVDDWESKLWSRFFCLSVYVTMYLNDHQRSAFYESLGMNTTDFNMHVIKETNKTTARIFPAVPDVESPEFKVRMDRLVDLNKQLSSIGATDGPAALKNLQKLPIIASMLWEMLVIFNMKPVECGSMDFYESEPQVVY